MSLHIGVAGKITGAELSPIQILISLLKAATTIHNNYKTATRHKKTTVYLLTVIIELFCTKYIRVVTNTVEQKLC
jgi:hypothetical protein